MVTEAKWDRGAFNTKRLGKLTYERYKEYFASGKITGGALAAMRDLEILTKYIGHLEVELEQERGLTLWQRIQRYFQR